MVISSLIWTVICSYHFVTDDLEASPLSSNVLLGSQNNKRFKMFPDHMLMGCSLKSLGLVSIISHLILLFKFLGSFV